MKKCRKLRFTALLLLTVMLISLCSCRLKKDDVNTAQTTEPSTVQSFAETQTGTDDVSTTLPEQTTAAVQTTKAPATQAPTEAQTEAPTEAVNVTGTKTLTDSNKTVVYPLALEYNQNRYPVVAWANGTGCPTQLYIKLIEAIANAGYIVVADSSVMTADGKAQIDSINYILGKNNDSSSVFCNRVDTYAIGVSGQSQGGRSCINAAQKDSRIRCVVSVAGASSADEARGLSVPCLFLTGTNDHIVVSSQWCKPSYDAVTGRAAYASLKGGDHLAFSTHTAEIADYTIAWFNAYLKNDADAQAVFFSGGRLANDSNWQDFQNKG